MQMLQPLPYYPNGGQKLRPKQELAKPLKESIRPLTFLEVKTAASQHRTFRSLVTDT